MIVACSQSNSCSDCLLQALHLCDCCTAVTKTDSVLSMFVCVEPTSGLDSFTANEVMRVVSNLARDGTTIATTIHSPSSYCFGLFHKLLILMSGKLVYFGEPGSAGISYFTGTCGARQPRVGDNLAEWMLDAVTQADRSECKASLSQTYMKSSLAQVSHDRSIATNGLSNNASCSVDVPCCMICHTS